MRRPTDVSIESKYLYSRDHTLRVFGRDRDANLDSLLTSLSVRIYFGQAAVQD